MKPKCAECGSDMEVLINGNSQYIELDKKGDKVLLLRLGGRQFVVAYGIVYEDDNKCFWRQGSYHDDLKSAVEEFYK